MHNSAVLRPITNLFGKVSGFANRNPTRMAIILGLGLYAFTVFQVPGAFSVQAISTLFMMTLLLSFASAGQTMVLIGGGMDFTVGAVMSVAAMITTSIMRGEDGRFLQAFAVCMLLGAAVGFINGVCTTKVGLPALVVTLAIGNVVTRMSYLVTAGTPVGRVGPAFASSVIYRHFGFIPSLALYALILFPLVFYILYRSRFGRQLYLVGNNPEAARLCGINVNKIKTISYMISGMLSAFTGMLGVGMLQASRNQMFDAYAYQSLIAVVVGGTSFAGGVGTYGGTIAGSMVMVMLNNMLTALNLSQRVREITLGLVLVLILVMYNRRKGVRQ
ncbi:MAG: ABC transporter permease [Oscillospiraceae bacterium]|nr:ABC transporter permease [Oscillospiraceae bacterium]